MKAVCLGLAMLACVVAASGCSSAPWRRNIVDDPRLKNCHDYDEPLPMRLAVAPVKTPLREEILPEKARERFSLTIDPQAIQESVIEDLNKFNIFSEVRALDVEAGTRPEALDETVMQAAWENDFDAVMSLNVKKFEVFYDGVNGWYLPNIINWLFLLMPSWWVKDEVYGVSMSIEATLRSARSGNVLYRKEFSAQFKRSLNDFQRGWQLFGIFRVPGSLGESNWRRIGRQLVPGVLREIQVQTILGLHTGLRPLCMEPDFERLIETRPALVVGISRYKDYNIPKLKYAEEDAIATCSHLTNPENGCIRPRNVRLLTNEHASKEEILKGLDYLARKSRTPDSAVIYFAGYGVSVPGKDKTDGPSLYLVPYDADLHDLEGSCVSLAAIEEKAARIQARELVIILDTSFGGTLESRALAGEAREAAILEKLLHEPGRYILLSGKPGEGAMEIDDHRHGAFTFYMIEGLKGPADSDKDDAITLGELHKYLSARVAEETEMEGSAQHPVLHGTGASEAVFKRAP